jgi:hypothetical protein
MNYLQLDKSITLTQFRSELEKARALYDCMVGTLYRDMVADDLNEGWTIFNTMLAERRNTLEYKAYITFSSFNMFQRIYRDAYDYITKFN